MDSNALQKKTGYLPEENILQAFIILFSFRKTHFQNLFSILL